MRRLAAAIRFSCCAFSGTSASRILVAAAAAATANRARQNRALNAACGSRAVSDARIRHQQHLRSALSRYAWGGGTAAAAEGRATVTEPAGRRRRFFPVRRHNRAAHLARKLEML